jgi:hypothetical protein
MAQLGVGSEISLRRHRGPIPNSHHLIKPSLSIVGCLLVSSQCATAATAITVHLLVQVVIFWRADRCSRFSASSPTCERPLSSAVSDSLTPFFSRAEQHRPIRLGTQSKFAGCPIICAGWLGRCWWHCASRVLRPPTLLRLDRVDGAGIFGRGGDLQKY